MKTPKEKKVRIQIDKEYVFLDSWVKVIEVNPPSKNGWYQPWAQALIETRFCSRTSVAVSELSEKT